MLDVCEHTSGRPELSSGWRLSDEARDFQKKHHCLHVYRGMFVSVAYRLKPQGWNNQKVVWIFHAGLFPHQARTFFIPTGDKGRQEAFRVFLQLQNYWGVTQLQSLGQSMHAHTHTMQAYSAKSGFAVCLTLPNSLRIQLDANRVILREKILPRTGIVSRL